MIMRAAENVIEPRRAGAAFLSGEEPAVKANVLSIAGGRRSLEVEGHGRKTG